MYIVVLGLFVVYKFVFIDILFNEWMKVGIIKIRDDLRLMCNKLLIYEFIKLRFIRFMGFFGIFFKYWKWFYYLCFFLIVFLWIKS